MSSIPLLTSPLAPVHPFTFGIFGTGLGPLFDAHSRMLLCVLASVASILPLSFSPWY